MCIFCETATYPSALTSLETDEEIVRRFRWEKLRHKCSVFVLIIDHQHTSVSHEDCIFINSDVPGEELVRRLMSLLQGQKAAERIILAITFNVPVTPILRLFWNEPFLEQNCSIKNVTLVVSPSLNAMIKADQNGIKEDACATESGIGSASGSDSDSDSDNELKGAQAEHVGRQLAVADVAFVSEDSCACLKANPLLLTKTSWTDVVDLNLFAEPWNPPTKSAGEAGSVVHVKISKKLDELVFTDWMWRIVTQYDEVFRVKGLVQFEHTEQPSIVHCISKHVDIRRVDTANEERVESWHLILLGTDLEKNILTQLDWLK